MTHENDAQNMDEKICRPEKKFDSAFTHAACLARHPGTMFLQPFIKRFEKKYLGKYKHARLLFTLDLLLVAILLSLGITALILFLVKPDLTEKIYFDAQVAPREIVSGAPSTLVIRYTNNTGEELRDAKLRIAFPEHFLLEHISEEEQTGSQEMELGTIAVDASGSVKIRGTMFGDVGGEQIFQSFLTFTHGKRNKREQKIAYHTFSPSRSTLVTELQMAKTIVASQEVKGMIIYKNTGNIDFPEITIEPEWPEGFTYRGGSTTLDENGWRLPPIKAGEEGQVSFSGQVTGKDEEMTFFFHPSFTFGNTRYKQESLTQTIGIIDAPLRLGHSIQAENLRPGTLVEAVVYYENVGDTPVRNLSLSLISESPFFRTGEPVLINEVLPGTSAEAIITGSIRSSVQQSELSQFENLTVTTRTRANYLFGEPLSQQITQQGDPLSLPLVTPITLHSFGRYSSPQGDQLGRGPLPPVIGEETKYWIFWHVTGTTNPLKQVNLSGFLPNNVRFTGRQSVSQNGSLTYDPTEQMISWSSEAVEATLDPNSKVIAVAFEVGITPTEDQIGSSAPLLLEALLTATDGRTGAFISASGASVTTDLPHDAMATGLGMVGTVSFLAPDPWVWTAKNLWPWIMCMHGHLKRCFSVKVFERMFAVRERFGSAPEYPRI